MTSAELQRATTLAGLNSKMDLLVTRAGYDSGLAFVPLASDVIIAPMPSAAPRGSSR
jgi:hypothetical protein